MTDHDSQVFLGVERRKLAVFKQLLQVDVLELALCLKLDPMRVFGIDRKTSLPPQPRVLPRLVPNRPERDRDDLIGVLVDLLASPLDPERGSLGDGREIDPFAL